MFPDIDMDLPPVSHRGPTHTVQFAFVVAAVTGVLGGLLGHAATSQWLLTIGPACYLALVGGLTISSHIAADALTPMGVTPFGDDQHYSYDLWNADSVIRELRTASTRDTLDIKRTRHRCRTQCALDSVFLNKTLRATRISVYVSSSCKKIITESKENAPGA